MIILDTNVISALIQRDPNLQLARWLDRHSRDDFWLTAISIFELRYGIEILAAGRNRSLLEDALDQLLDRGIKNPILVLDGRAAATAASIAAERKKIGRPAELRDTLIAGIAVAHRAAIATRNVRHFQNLDIQVVDPWSEFNH